MHVVQPIVRELPQTCGTRILNVVDAFIAGLLPGVQSKIRSDLLSLYRRFIDAGGDRASMAASAPLDQSGSQSMPTPAKDEAETAAQEKSEALQWAVMVRHLVKETIAFDKSLSELYGYRHETTGVRRGSNGSGTAATSATTDGPCLSIVTGDPKRFEAWLSIERFCRSSLVDDGAIRVFVPKICS